MAHGSFSMPVPVGQAAAALTWILLGARRERPLPAGHRSVIGLARPRLQPVRIDGRLLDAVVGVIARDGSSWTATYRPRPKYPQSTEVTSRPASADMNHPAGPPAGWYADLDGSGAKRYWDGKNWCVLATSRPGSAATSKDDEYRKDRKWSAVWAALTAVLAVVAAIGYSYNEAYGVLFFLAFITGCGALVWFIGARSRWHDRQRARQRN